MRVCVPITDDGQVDPRWGRADRVAVASVVDGQIADWQEFTVGWGTMHDAGTEGAHHARVARFLRDNQVQAVAVRHVGPGMHRMLGSMAIQVVDGQCLPRHVTSAGGREKLTTSQRTLAVFGLPARGRPGLHGPCCPTFGVGVLCGQ